MILKKTCRKLKNKSLGAAMLEMLIILPIFVSLILILWEQAKFFDSYLSAVQATHYGLWRSVDFRNNEGDVNSSTDTSDAREILEIFDGDNINHTNVSISDGDVGGVAGFAGDVLDFIDMFGLNSQGKWTMRMRGNHDMSEGAVMNGLFQNDDDTSDSFGWDFSETLLIDPWDARSPGGTTSGQVAERVAGGWLGPIGALGGAADFISDLLGIIGIDVPRVNLSEVPFPD